METERHWKTVMVLFLATLVLESPCCWKLRKSDKHWLTVQMIFSWLIRRMRWRESPRDSAVSILIFLIRICAWTLLRFRNLCCKRMQRAVKNISFPSCSIWKHFCTVSWPVYVQTVSINRWFTGALRNYIRIRFQKRNRYPRCFLIWKQFSRNSGNRKRVICMDHWRLIQSIAFWHWKDKVHCLPAAGLLHLEWKISLNWCGNRWW